LGAPNLCFGPPSQLSMDILKEEDQILKIEKSKSTSELQILLLQQVIWWRNEEATSDCYESLEIIDLCSTYSRLIIHISEE